MRILIIFIGIVLWGGASTSCFSQELPIKLARTISFATDEGSYINVDLSPDGKTLAFDLLGDIYTVPVTGGEAKQLTRGIALHLRPVWSPDGKRISFFSDSTGYMHLQVMLLHDRSRMILGATDPDIYYGENTLWTPDSRSLVYRGSGYCLLGGKIKVNDLIKQPLRFTRNGIFGVDSDRICYVDIAQHTKVKFNKTPKYALDLNISADGHWLSYIKDTAGNRSLFITDIGSGQSKVLVSSLITIDKRYSPGVPLPHYAFSSDSRNIYVSYGGKIHRIGVETGKDEIIPFEANVKCDLGPLDYNTYRVSHDPFQVRYARSASVSPDGKRLLFMALHTLYVKDLPDGKPRVLVQQPISQFQPCWSPDGKWVAYVTWCDTTGGQLWRVPSNGGKPEQLTKVPGQYQRPTWSPDNKSIAVIKGLPNLGDRDDPGMGDLQLISLNGNVRNLADSIPLWNNLQFSADGKRIIYTPKLVVTANSQQFPQMVSLDVEGKHPQILATGRGITFYQQKAISPDGKWLVYSADEDLYLIPTCPLRDITMLSDYKERLPVIRFAEGVDPYWEQGGKVLAWTYSNKFYRIAVDKIINAAEQHLRQTGTVEPEKDFTTIKITPDQVFDLNLTVPSEYGKGIIALQNAKIITMQGDEVIEKGTIIVANGKFTEVGAVNKVIIPKGAKVYNLQGKTIMPGIVDLHLHMRVPPNIFPQQSWMFLANLAYGVTSARDPAASFDSFGYTELLRAGRMLGPRLYTVGRPARLFDGLLRDNRLEDLDELVTKRKELGGTFIKDYLLTQPRLPRQWLLQASAKEKMNITNEGWSDPIMELAMIKDGSSGVEHNPMWGDVYSDFTRVYAKSGTYFTPTLQVSSGAEVGEGKEYFKYKFWHTPNEKLKRFTYSDPNGTSRINSSESYEAIINTTCPDSLNPQFLTNARIDAKIRNMGGRVTMGSHGEAEGIGPHDEIWALQMGGISNMQALQAATIMGAQALGIQEDVGSIEPGKIADLIVLNSNPLDDIHNTRDIKYVMKDGILYEGDTLDELWPVKKKCPEWKLNANILIKKHGDAPQKLSGGIPDDDND